MSSVTITGTSTNNDYVSSTVTPSSGTVSGTTIYSKGGTSNDDTFYQLSSKSTNSGTLESSDPSTGTSLAFTTSNGTGFLTTSNKAVSINDPHIIGNGSTTTTSSSIGYGSFLGNPTIAADKPYDSLITNTTGKTYTIKNNNSAFVSATAWTASLVNGKTVYTNGTGKQYSGPLNLINVTSLTITNGAVVDGLIIGQQDPTAYTITIRSGGTLQNSFVVGATIVNSGTSLNNTYISPKYTGAAGSTSEGDYMLASGNNSYYFDFSSSVGPIGAINATPDLITSVTLNGNASFDSYMQNGIIGGSFTFNRSGAATINCFLAGTLINTVNGLIAIENIKVGDQVIAYVGNKEEIRSVIWTGHNTAQTNQSLSKEDANYPVRILKNAISEGVPFKDLLVTPEHCILLDGQFILVRMLINGSSIFYDCSITDYTYYHIETEQHSVIAADGVLTESYLDTGNRSGFISDDNIVSIVNHHKEWNVDSAAPLVTAREIVEPIFKDLTQRIPELGLNIYKTDALTTYDSSLYLLTDSGKPIYSQHQNNGRFIFILPQETTKVRLISCTSRPSQAIGPYVDDRRNLGILVGNITLLEKNKTHSITEHFTSKSLQGWDVQEQGNHRWTNGHALLNVHSKASDNIGVLIIEVINCGPYILEEKVA